MSAASPSTLLFQDILSQFYARRLLLRAPLFQTPAAAASQPPVAGNSSSSIDANVVMVLSVLLCALICSLGLNSIVRCALRCSSFVAANSESRTNPVSARLANTNTNTNTNTGIKKKALKSFPILNYSDVVVKVEAGLGLDTECVICLSEFVPSAKVKVLPKCYHVFHVGCIDKWLNSHSTCPTCRDSLIDTCQKITTRGGGCCCRPATTSSSSSSSATVLQPHTTTVTVSIPPLEPEGFTRNYRGSI